MQLEDFVKEYEAKSNEELLCLALDPSQLTDEANQALFGALRKRGIDNKELSNFRQQEDQRKREDESNLGRLWISARGGIGRKRFCKGNYHLDPSTGIEEFTTTVFILILWMPLIPTSTYRARRNKKSLSSHLRGIENLPLDWEQVVQVWLITLLGILAIMVALKFFMSHY